MITREELLKLLQTGKTPEELASAFTSTLNEAMNEAKRMEEAEKERLAAEEAKFEIFCDMYSAVFAYIDLVEPNLLPKSEEPKPLTKEDMNRVDRAIRSVMSIRSSAKKMEDAMRKHLPKDFKIKTIETPVITGDEFLGFFDSLFN